MLWQQWASAQLWCCSLEMYPGDLSKADRSALFVYCVCLALKRLCVWVREAGTQQTVTAAIGTAGQRIIDKVRQKEKVDGQLFHGFLLTFMSKISFSTVLCSFQIHCDVSFLNVFLFHSLLQQANPIRFPGNALHVCLCACADNLQVCVCSPVAQGLWQFQRSWLVESPPPACW